MNQIVDSEARAMTIFRSHPKESCLAVLSLVVVAALLVVLVTRGKSQGQAQRQRLGDTTTKPDLIAALKTTGFNIRYRKVPRLEEYELVAGEATKDHIGLQFSVEIRRAGTFQSIKDESEEISQPSVLRYGFEEEGEVVGNVRYKTVIQEPFVAGKKFVLEPTRAAQQMQIRFDLVIRELFAPKFRPGV